MEFSRGDKVEVCGKEEGFVGSYYGAKVHSKIGKNKYIVVYKNLLKEDESGPLIEVVSAKNIRPQPRLTMAPIGLSRKDKVDAFYNDGWWVGQVIARKGTIFTVYFETTGEEIAFPWYRLRFHQDWINGEWVSSKKRVHTYFRALKQCRVDTISSILAFKQLQHLIIL